ncbi:hypothetical protein FA95DRAFT_1684867 [Auriscalpium vulgare]|uniref:Uncharacterized protein n=1 Tax=Auriscalpium vulgare TaxID=40419 RepID=A0ACB8R096_9AGAM|nr:hypothetical protein FA95DRAFT_1684867 [Auriscalpium vulgare]
MSLTEESGHGGIKGVRVMWMGDKDCTATTGFSRMSDRRRPSSPRSPTASSSRRRRSKVLADHLVRRLRLLRTLA